MTVRLILWMMAGSLLSTGSSTQAAGEGASLWGLPAWPTSTHRDHLPQKKKTKLHGWTFILLLVWHPGFCAEVTVLEYIPLLIISVLGFRWSVVIVLFVTLLWFYAADLSPFPSPITANLMVFQGKAVRYDHATILNNKELYLPFLLIGKYYRNRTKCLLYMIMK